MTALQRSAVVASTTGVATSQRGWGEALASLLTSRGIPAMALDPSGHPWRGVDVDDDVSSDATKRWRVLVVDAADDAAVHIVSSLPADARVALGEPCPSLLGEIHVWVEPSDARRLVTAVRDPSVGTHRSGRSRRRLSEPTTRERAVLELLREGLSNSEIAVRLAMSPNTVRTHVQNLLAKLGVHSRFEAAVIANSEHPDNDREVSR